jgi:hypothetical protein
LITTGSFSPQVECPARSEGAVVKVADYCVVFQLSGQREFTTGKDVFEARAGIFERLYLESGVGLPSAPRDFGRKPTSEAEQWTNSRRRELNMQEKRGSFEGTIKSPLRSPSFPVNDLA